MKTFRLFLSLFLILFLLCSCQQSSVPDKVTTRSVASVSTDSAEEKLSIDKSLPTENTVTEKKSTATLKPTSTPKSNAAQYVLNLNTKKFHNPSCSSVKQMKEKNKKVVTKTREEIIADGYSPCGRCHP